MKFIRNLFNNKKQKSNTSHKITCGIRDENGFADTYIDGKKTNVRLLIWTKEEIEKLHKISEEIYNKKKNNKPNR